MNFELLSKKILNKIKYQKNFNEIKLLKKIWIKLYINLIQKKKKLKLGLISFEIKKIEIYEIILFETIDIKYLKQDTTQEDEQKLENIIKKFYWKNNFENFFSIFLILIIFWKTIKPSINQYKNFFIDNIFNTPWYFFFFSKYFFKILFSPFSFFNNFNYFSFNEINYSIIDLILNLMINYNLIF